jgi:hypothetical protein
VLDCNWAPPDCLPALLSCSLRYKKGSHPKGRNVFTKDIEPFIRWLEEAEEEEDEEQ